MKARKKGSCGNKPGLSCAQLRVMRLLARGLKRREIAEQLHLSIHTVDRHIADSYVKLGVHNTASAATKLMEGNLLGLVVIRPPRNIGDDEKWMDPSIVNMRCSI